VNLPDLLPTSKLVIDTTAWLVITPLRIAMIVLVALIARWLAHRAIRRVIRAGGNGEPPLVLRPLKEKAPAVFAEAAKLRSERRRQRAETIGSLLRNVASITIFTIAAMLVLAELQIDLAPLLASAGIAGLALGFGAQYVVRDVISGVFMITEDQYGVGDTVDLGEATGTVEAVGLRVTTVRDVRGVVWYVRNGEVLRVGNHSQGWNQVVIDVPIGFGTSVDEAMTVIRDAATAAADEPDIRDKVTEPPEVLGVEDVGLDGPLVRLVVKTAADAAPGVGRLIRRRIVTALDEAGVTDRLAAARMHIRPPGGKDGAGPPA
jgi:small conductance mechanosensitive channel